MNRTNYLQKIVDDAVAEVDNALKGENK